jgi:hypothetical protein
MIDLGEGGQGYFWPLEGEEEDQDDDDQDEEGDVDKPTLDDRLNWFHRLGKPCIIHLQWITHFKPFRIKTRRF